MSSLEKEEPVDITPTTREPVDEKSDATVGRKVSNLFTFVYKFLCLLAY